MDQMLAQRRARCALKTTQSVKGTACAQDFRSSAVELPALLHMAGLGQAAAFYRSKAGSAPRIAGPGQQTASKPKDEAYAHLYHALSDWLTQSGMPLAGFEDLLEGITAVDQARYRWAQAEAQALAGWIARLAKALIAAPAEATTSTHGRTAEE